MRFLIVPLLLANAAFAQAPFNFTVNGTLKNYPNDSYIYLHHKWDNATLTDSAKVKDGTFSFKGKSKEANMYWLTKTNNSNTPGNLIFFADPGKLKITGNADSLSAAQVSGGPTQADYVAYNAMMQNFSTRQQQITNVYNQARSTGDAATMQAKVAEYQALDAEVKSKLKDFIKAHPKSAVSGYAIYFNYQNANAPMEELENVVGLLDKSILNTKYGKLAQERLMSLRGTTIGYEAMNFSQNDPNGKPVQLTDFKGKYVLVDFWASWCGPCRAENPNVVAAYNKYKDKGFTVLGVSLDQNKANWLKAIDSDQLTWAHVSDLKGWGNEAAKAYGITSIPQNLLLDKNGKILAKNLRGEALEQALAELFK